MSELNSQLSRINFTGDFQPVIDSIAKSFSLGGNAQFTIFDVGYEDCNVKINTETGVYVAKMFSKDRTQDDIARYVTILEKVMVEYERYVSLSDLEKQHLYAYAIAGAAMEFMGAHQEKFINGNDTEETDFWLQLGRSGLRKELAGE